MKRYVKEFANDVKMKIKADSDTISDIKNTFCWKIDKTLLACEAGMATEIDTVKTLIGILDTFNNIPG